MKNDVLIRLFRYVPIVLLALGIVGCDIFPSSDDGAVQISFTASSRSINYRPADIGIDSYKITLQNGSTSITVNHPVSGGDYVIDALRAGIWTVTVEGLNTASEMIAFVKDGPLELSVRRGRVTNAAALLVPLEENTGSLKVEINLTSSVAEETYIRENSQGQVFLRNIDGDEANEIGRIEFDETPASGEIIIHGLIPGWYEVTVWLVEKDPEPEPGAPVIAGGRRYWQKVFFAQIAQEKTTEVAQIDVQAFRITYKDPVDIITDGENLTIYTASTDTIVLKDPVKSGSTFEGWYDNYDGETYTDQVTTIPRGSSGDRTLYAKWIVSNTYTVTFDAQGGSEPDPLTKTVTLEEPYGELPVVTKDNVVFSGWWTGTEGQGDRITADTVVTIAEDHTLYAYWVVTNVGSTGPGGGIIFYDKGVFDKRPVKWDGAGWVVDDEAAVYAEPWQYLEAAPFDLEASWEGIVHNPGYEYDEDGNLLTDGITLWIYEWYWGPPDFEAEDYGTLPGPLTIGFVNTYEKLDGVSGVTPRITRGLGRPAVTDENRKRRDTVEELKKGINGLTDWYIPAKYELELLYQELYKGSGTAETPENTGNFTFAVALEVNPFYWSSTEFQDGDTAPSGKDEDIDNYSPSDLLAWMHDFSTGEALLEYRYELARVRPIRRF